MLLDRLFALANNGRMEPFAGLEAFVRVVEAGSFTGAAQALQTAKSTVSDTIRGLEERLGVRLLDRTTRRVRTTEAGQAFYLRCRRLIEEAEAARAEAKARQEAPMGRLRIAAPEGFGELYIVPSLTRFLAAFPGVTVDLVESAVSAPLIEGDMDLAIRIAETVAPSMVVRRIGASQVLIVAAPSYLASNGVPKVPADLIHHHCLGFSPLPWRDTWRLGEEKVIVRPRLLSNASASLRAAAMAGIGLVALPDWCVAEALTAGRLERVLTCFETPKAEIYAVYPTNRLISPSVRAFVDHLASDLRARGVAP